MKHAAFLSLLCILLSSAPSFAEERSGFGMAPFANRQHPAFGASEAEAAKALADIAPAAGTAETVKPVQDDQKKVAPKKLVEEAAPALTPGQ